MKTNLVVEYCGNQISEKELIASIKREWVESGHKVGDIKTMDLYVKPEEAATYYVINGTESRKINL